LPDVFVVPEQDFVVAGNAEMVQLFHSCSSLSGSKIRILR
jgi:hypothetical protein